MGRECQQMKAKEEDIAKRGVQRATWSARATFCVWFCVGKAQVTDSTSVNIIIIIALLGAYRQDNKHEAVSGKTVKGASNGKDDARECA